MPPANTSTERRPDERTPLINAQNGQPGSAPAADTSADDRPLPRGQLFLLCFARLVEPVAFFSIFPFISQMVYELGVPTEQCGFYTGLIEALFSFIQFLIMPIWGRYSDKRGRKPLLVQSLLGLAVTSTLFGLSRHVWQMILFRCLAGFFSGSTVTLRTMVSEISTTKTQARAFSLFAFGGNTAIFLAPLMGGALSKPAENFKAFKHVKLFIEFPYLLPCMVTGSLALIAALVSFLFLKETLAPVTKSESEIARETLTVRQILAHDGVIRVLAVYLSTFTLAFSYTALAPVFYFTPTHLGGYGFTPQQISYLLAAGGASQAFWTLVVFPSLHKRVGSIGVLRGSAVGWAVQFVVFAAVNLGLRHGLSETAFWTIAIIFAVIGSAISMSFTSVQLCLNDISPAPSALGTLNGIGLSGMALTRSIAPPIVTSIFAYGVSRQIIYGQLAWAVLFVVAIGNNVVVSYLPRTAWGLVRKTDHISQEDDEA